MPASTAILRIIGSIHLAAVLGRAVAISGTGIANNGALAVAGRIEWRRRVARFDTGMNIAVAAGSSMTRGKARR